MSLVSDKQSNVVRSHGGEWARLLTASVVALTVVVIGCAASQADVTGTTTLDLRVSAGPLTISHHMTGKLVAEEAVEFSAPNVGVFPLQIGWLASEGSQVEPGDTVVEFDNSSLASNLEQLETQIEQAETSLETALSTAATDLAQAAFELEQAQSTLRRARIEADIPEGLKSEVEMARLRLELEKAELEETQAVRNLASSEEAAKSDVAVAEVELEKALRAAANAEAKIDRLALRAPRQGIVVVQENYVDDRPFQIGDNVQPGMRVVRLPDLDTMVVRADLFDVDDGAIETGLDAEIELDAFPGEVLRGRVRLIDRVAQQPSRRSSRRVFSVVIDVPELDRERVRPGMSVRVSVERRVDTVNGESVRLVPRSALQQRLTETRVALYRGGWQSVEIGDCSSMHCVLLEGPELGTRLRMAVGAES